MRRRSARVVPDASRVVFVNRAGFDLHEPLKFGFITDVHSGDLDTMGDVNYRDGLAKIATAVAHFNTIPDLDFVLQCGDHAEVALASSPEQGLADLQAAVAALAEADAPVKHVLGNHDPGPGVPKATVISEMGMPAAYYAFQAKGLTCVVLDSSGTSHGATQLAWLAQTLAGVPLAVVFTHRWIHSDGHAAATTDAAQVRGILEAAGNVAAVFTGHNHSNEFKVINGIPYYAMQAGTRRAGAECARAVVTITGREVTVEGFDGQTSYPAD